MILINDKKECCGCAACVQACPKQCIAFEEDKQGFRYPTVDVDHCINCGLCERVCPVLNQDEHCKPMAVYAAINPNEEIRLKSSSGGIFTMIAELIIQEGGVVIGARFGENLEVIHDVADSIEELEAFRGSKYMQSLINNCYKRTFDFLKQGRKVLFTGTPCQIAGLRKFLRRDYDNLLTVDVVCHGVPSPMVWRSYLNEKILRPKGAAGKNTVLLSLKVLSAKADISFRDKTTGWKKYGFVVREKSASKAEKNSVLLSANSEKQNQYVVHETLWNNLFMRLFLTDLCLRPSCYHCPTKDGKSGSDITLADYWGIENHHPEWDDDKGTSLVLIHTAKGAEMFASIDARKVSTTYEEALAGNKSIEQSVTAHKWVPRFWDLYYQSGLRDIERFLNSMGRPSIYARFRHLVSKISLKFKRFI